MLALHYRRSVPRYVAAKLVGKRYPGIVTGVASAIHLEDVPEPKLPTAQWVRVRPLLSGICGSDVAVITAEGTPYLSALVSFPFVPGHELVGEIVEVGGRVSGLAVGQRVVVEPALGCRVRGFAEPCVPCRAGYYAACERVMDGDVSSGIQTGFCRDTGGGWGPSLVAHQSQLYPVPDALSNEAAVLVEPLACAIHGVLRSGVQAASAHRTSLPSQGENRTEEQRTGGKRSPLVLVLGCGTIGLLTVAALRAFAPECTIVAVAKYPHQQALAKDLGAEHVVSSGQGAYARLQDLTGASLLKLPWGKPHVVGGVDASFVCISSAGAWEDALRWTRARGTVVMVGMPGEPKADLTPFWYKELAVLGAYTYGVEHYGEGQATTFRLALDMLARQGWAERLAPLVRHKFPLPRYREAFATAMHAGKHQSVKVVFDVGGVA